MPNKLHCKASAFSLIQLSGIVLAAGLVAAAVIPEGGGESNASRYLTTIKRMEKIEDASVKMMAVEGRRPCPASGEYYPGHAKFGKEDGTAGDCADSGATDGVLTPFDDTNVIGGTVPSTTLNLPQEYYFDGWGRPFTYAVDKRATDPLECVQIVGSGEVEIYPTDGGTKIDSTMYTLISHGPDGHGAFLPGGSTRTNRIDAGSTDADQRNNAGASGVANFSTTPYKNEWVKKETGANYDDVTWYSERRKNTCCVGKECGENIAAIPPPVAPSYTGFRIDGTVASNPLGAYIASGDFNGDGIDDIVVDRAGAGYGVTVVFGKAESIATQTVAGFANGTDGFDITGTWVMSLAAGDINGDGIDDILIGHTNAYAVFVVFGRSTWPASVTLASQLNGTNGFKVSEVIYLNYFGRSVAAGDINNDGIDDIIIGAEGSDYGANKSGSIYVLFGKTTPWSSDFTAPVNGTAGFRYDGLVADAYLGRSVAVGDITGDGIKDIIGGAHSAGGGSVHVIFGKSSAWAGVSDASSLDGTNGFLMTNPASVGMLGYDTAVGDINGDGIQDLLASAPYLSQTKVLFGKTSAWASTFTTDTLTGTTGFSVGHTGQWGGWSVASGNINGDGFDDIIAGSYNDGNGRGRTYVYFGKASGWTWNVDGTDGFLVKALNYSDQAGEYVGAVDVNNDGIDDLLIGDTYTDYNALNISGTCFVTYGSSGPWSALYTVEDLTNQ